MECLTKLRPLSCEVNLWLPLCPSAEEAYDQIMIIWDKAEVIKVSDNALEHLEVPRGDKGCRYCTKVLLVQRLSAASFGVGGLPGNLVCDGGLGEGCGWF